MNIAGDFVFAAPRQIAWDALQDPKVLASVLPGCERLDLIAENEYEGDITLKIGPVQGSFSGKVKLEQLQPPESFHMVIDGRGQQGFVKATANITLADEGDATRIVYNSDAQVGGRIATVGMRLIETSARAIVKQSLAGIDAAMRLRAAAAQTTMAAGASVDAGSAAAAAVVPDADARPSQAAFAAGVAREVARDLMPTVLRRALILIALAALVWVVLALVR